MTQQKDNDVQARVVRLLDLMGRMIQEVGGLVEAQSAAALPTAPAETTASDESAAEPAAPPTVPEAVEIAEPEPQDAHITPPEGALPEPELPEPKQEGLADGEIEEALNVEFANLFGEDTPRPRDRHEEEPPPDGPSPDIPAAVAGTGAEAAPTIPETTPLEDPAEQPAAKSEPAPVANQLYLVCEGEQGRRLAIPWGWIVDTQLSQAGAPEAFTLMNGEDVRKMKVKKVRGIWSAKELQDWSEDVHWVTDLKQLAHPSLLGVAEVEGPDFPEPPEPLPEPPAEAPEIRPARTVVLPDLQAEGAGLKAVVDPNLMAPLELDSMDQPLADPEEAVFEDESGGQPLTVWVVSPSALARRFLMRHLDETGIEVHEARDLDDPLLPADLEGAGALFLDESLREHWSAHPMAATIRVPLVLLTVDGNLRVPAAGVHSAEGAALPRPFERSEVETVVTWLRSLWDQDSTGGNGAHGDSQNDTWLFADPFGNADSGKRPGRG